MCRKGPTRQSTPLGAVGPNLYVQVNNITPKSFRVQKVLILPQPCVSHTHDVLFTLCVVKNEHLHFSTYRVGPIWEIEINDVVGKVTTYLRSYVSFCHYGVDSRHRAHSFGYDPKAIDRRS